ncbi:DUF411 domain-containing protein [Kiloniella majae]|uniref:DUF411 domain-containing protein n=1 Tax=Kiloniella majae TaxID=1938558 RepID=UPI001C3FF21D|nr:DUF411 domain-containing protein [Kiloniella majae]
MKSFFPATTLVTIMFINLLPTYAHAGEAEATLFKNPQCGCCSAYAEHLRQNDYKVKEVPTEKMSLIKKSYGITDEMSSCHTTLIDGYVIEGHIPINIVDKFLSEKPDVKGIFLPGMPMGSPGMEMGVEKEEPFRIYSYDIKENNHSITLYAIE